MSCSCLLPARVCRNNTATSFTQCVGPAFKAGHCSASVPLSKYEDREEERPLLLGVVFFAIQKLTAALVFSSIALERCLAMDRQ